MYWFVPFLLTVQDLGARSSDVSNHETYVVLFLGMCVTWVAATAFYC